MLATFRSPEDIPVDDWRHKQPRFQGDNFDQNFALVQKIEVVAAKKGCTPAQLALAWLLTHPSVVVIPGSKHRARLEENIASATVSLEAANLADLEEAAPVGVATGTRYPAAAMATVHQ